MQRNPILTPALVAISVLSLLAGCGMPGPPQPPSLKLPKVVQDLDAVRSGSQVVLHWTGPRENTDKTNVDAGATAVICRRGTPDAASCDRVGSVVNRPGEAMEFTDVLPAALQAGDARVIAYEVATENRREKNAGWSLAVRVAAGQAAPDLTALTAANTAHGVSLAWQSAAPSIGEIVVRIFRTRLSDEKIAQTTSGKKSGMQSEEEPAERTLEVAADTRQAVDLHVAWGQRYSYRVQAVKKVRLQTDRGLVRYELAGAMSNAATVETKNVFPPEAPRGLAVVPVWADDDKPGMDLSWEPNTESTLAGYRIYRSVELEAGTGFGAEELISGSAVLTAPAFADRGLAPGASYRYWVVAEDASGNVSPHSRSDTEKALRSRN